MTGVAAPSVPWSRRRWITTVSALMAAQLGLILYFGERPHLLPRTIRSKTTIYMAVDPLSAKQVAELPSIVDPTLFALPSLQGFSGKSWLTFKEPDYSVKSSSEGPAFLAPDVNRLGETFFRFVSSNSPLTLRLAGQGPPEFGPVQISVPPIPFNAASQLRIEGAIRNLRLMNPINIPSWPSGDVLANTVVQVIVDGLGNVISSTLLASSGSAGADRYALTQAASARFEPSIRLDRASLSTFGTFIFQWHTISAAETNSPPVQP